MYDVVGADGKLYPAELGTLIEWAQSGFIHPDSVLIDRATEQRLRADQILVLQPIFARRITPSGLPPPRLAPGGMANPTPMPGPTPRPAPAPSPTAATGVTPTAQQPWFIVLFLLCFFPVGLILTWMHPRWSQTTKIAITAVVGIMAIVGAFAPGAQTPTAPQPVPAPGTTVTSVSPTPAPQAETTTPTTPAEAQDERPKMPAEVRVYAHKMLDPIQALASGMGAVSQLSLEAGRKPTLLNDDDWKMRVGIQLGVMRASAENMAGVKPVPPEMERTHEMMDEINREVQACTIEYAKGIDEMNSDAIGSAARRIEKIGRLVGEATNEMNKVNARYP